MGKCIKKYNDLLLNNGQAKNNLPKKHIGWNYNCWGLTAYLKGWYCQEEWLEEYDIRELLDAHTIEVYELKLGDIAVFVGPDEDEPEDTVILHTGILVDVEKQLILHKRGSWILSVNTIKHTMYNIYPATEEVYYVREIEK